MNKSYVIHGPAGCGKSTNAHRIKKSFGLSHVVDDWNWGMPAQRFGHLYLTNQPPPAGLGYEADRRIMSFADWQKQQAAIDKLRGLEA